MTLDVILKLAHKRLTRYRNVSAAICQQGARPPGLPLFNQSSYRNITMATTISLSTATEASLQKVDAIFQVRTGKKRAVFGLSNPSAIFKIPHSKPVKFGFLGCEGGEHGYIGHGGPDKALMHYPSQHYKSWKEDLPENAHLFAVGGFGENIVSESVSENDICIGDI
jgi:hypothetical protein